MDAEELQEVLKSHQKWLTHTGGTRANLYDANLTRANLYGANLTRANLYGANLTRANLDDANLEGANLEGANLDDANLTRANLYGANLEGARNLPAFQIPAGDLIVFKKLTTAIATLKICSHVPRTATLIGRKCRAASAFVLSLSSGTEATAMYDGTLYRVNETVIADSYDDSHQIECTHGIHFFLTREEAEAY